MFDPGGPSSGLKEALVSGNNTFLADEHEAAKLRWAGGAQCPFGMAMRPKTGARSARARTRGQNPLVVIYFWKSQTFGKSLETFGLQIFFLEYSKIHRLVWIFL
jgi:hypothetical protein